MRRNRDRQTARASSSLRLGPGWLCAGVGLIGLALTATGADAQRRSVGTIEVKFTESAPTDSFTITNTGDCSIGFKRLVIDLGKSRAGLVFDVTGGGAGVEVFQPLKFARGRANVVRVSRVKDGDTEVTLHLLGLTERKEIRFTVDVDDTQPAGASGQTRGQSQIGNSEIAGAEIRVGEPNEAQERVGVFGSDGVAKVEGLPCK